MLSQVRNVNSIQLSPSINRPYKQSNSDFKTKLHNKTQYIFVSLKFNLKKWDKQITKEHYRNR